MNFSSNIEPLITIGMPVYNGEKFLRRALNALLIQTFANFQLIISDNSSIDSTSTICEEYAKKDTRIMYIRQKNNMGPWWNFEYVLRKAKSKYFMWAAVDDTWDSDFLEKNINILESKNNVVGSISDLDILETDTEISKIDIDHYKFRKVGRYQFVHSLYGTYHEKAAFLLMRLGWARSIYAIFRTKELQKSMVRLPFANADFAILLNVLKYGDLHVIDEVLMHRGLSGSTTSTKSLLDLLSKQNVRFPEKIIPYGYFTLWCLKNLGIKFFSKNFMWFFRLNYHAERKIFAEVMNLLRYKFN